ncbi:acyl carrier protein [Kitasatospora purpeofusca]|uniref:acyl carrier protein n=1 Tax=Kitasatospora purpeofusca TaxID=67352 RepID=UPI0036859869
MVADLLAETFQVRRSDIREESGLADLGLDSLARVELGAELKDRFGVAVPEDILTATSPLSDVLNFVRYVRGSQ